MQHSYVLLHKPYNVLCQFTDDSPQGPQRQTLKDFVPIPDVYSVGRLDLDSEGLLLLTDDAKVKHCLCEPKFAHPRTYWVQVENIPDDRALEQLRRGVVIQGKKTRPAIARLMTPEPLVPPREPPVRFRKNIPTAWIELTLTEGRNRQVRRMTAAVGYPTLRLIRVAMGAGAIALNLAGLAPGEWRHLTMTETQALQRLADRGPRESRAVASKKVSPRSKRKRR
ncbi:pseudouridine synthase [Synechococcus moorigangaii CMS01]|nr:pseudouridine synthase [Synechococcus moorigangaii CMS01]